MTTAKCGRTDPHGGHHTGPIQWCAGNIGVVWAADAVDRPNVAILASDEEWSMVILALEERSDTFRRLAGEDGGRSAACLAVANDYGLLAAHVRRAVQQGAHVPASAELPPEFRVANVSRETLTDAQAAELDRLDGRR
jgi:hypothetical protein